MGIFKTYEMRLTEEDNLEEGMAIAMAAYKLDWSKAPNLRGEDPNYKALDIPPGRVRSLTPEAQVEQRVFYGEEGLSVPSVDDPGVYQHDPSFPKPAGLLDIGPIPEVQDWNPPPPKQLDPITGLVGAIGLVFLAWAIGYLGSEK